MDEKYASLLRFVILGVAAAAHHYAVTPPTSSSVEESYVMGSEGLVEGQDLDTVSWEGKRGDIGGKASEGVLHEKSITLLQLGLKLCSWSRVSLPSYFHLAQSQISCFNITVWCVGHGCNGRHCAGFVPLPDFQAVNECSANPPSIICSYIPAVLSPIDLGFVFYANVRS